MRYCDYEFELLSDGSILLDKELPLDHLKHIKEWDTFVLTLTDAGQILLKRVDHREDLFTPFQLELNI